MKTGGTRTPPPLRLSIAARTQERPWSRRGAQAGRLSGVATSSSLRSPRRDQPVLSPTTNQPIARMPTAKIVSPMARSQRKRLEDRRLHELRAARIPQAVLHAGPGLGQPDRQQAEQDHQGEPDVRRPEADPQPARLPTRRWWSAARRAKSVRPMPSMP